MLESKRAAHNEYHRKYKKRRYHARKRKYRELLGGKCKGCGSKERLEFDHREHGTREHVITMMLTCLPEKLVLKELAKCQLLCHKCHRLKSIEEMGHKVAAGTHGTISSRRYCDCDLCKEAARRYMQLWRDKRRAAGWRYTSTGWIPPA